jgi:hypothetical protein
MMRGGGRFAAGRRGGGRFPGRGRGRNMAAGRGGMAARGHGQVMQRTWGVHSYLAYFNQYISVKIAQCLTLEDKRNLGQVYPKFKPRELTPEQKEAMEQRNAKMMEKQKQMIEAKKNQVCIADMLEEKDGKTGETKETEVESEEAQTEDQKQQSEQSSGNGGEDSTEAKDEADGETTTEAADDGVTVGEDGEKTPPANPVQRKLTPEQLKAQETQMSMNLTDPHTLLARLNTRRLYRRLKHYRKQDPDIDYKKVYPMQRTTEQIAVHEWQQLLADFKENQIRLMKERERKAAEAAKALLEEEEGTETRKDEDLIQEEKKQEGEGEEKSLDRGLPSPIPSKCEMLLFSPCPRAVAVLASYPRSGNSLLRTLYERTSLRVTGSDMRGGLQKHDLVGEMATQANTVQFVKTHYPERMGQPPFRVNRAVLLVRNPYDALESYFNLMTTNTHTASLSADERKKHEKIFAEMALKEILVWRDFHEFWLNSNIPLLVIRYEDLIRWTDKVISKVLKFVLEINDMKFFEERIDRCIREEQIEKLGSYKPRSGGIGKSLTKGVYSPELLQQINVGILETMAKFGYDEMFVPDPSQWKLEPLDQLGVYIPGTRKEPLVINQKGLVRGPKRQTNWMQVKRQMQMKDQKCTCFNCLKGSR